MYPSLLATVKPTRLAWLWNLEVFITSSAHQVEKRGIAMLSKPAPAKFRFLWPLLSLNQVSLNPEKLEER